MSKCLLFSILFLNCVIFAQIKPIKGNESKNVQYTQPMAFIENKGQWNKEVKYLAKMNGMNAWITSEGIVYDFYKYENLDGSIVNKKTHKPDLKKIENIVKTGQVVKMFFEGTEISKSSYLGERKRTEYYNYIKGRSQSISFVPLFNEVQAEQIFNGINARYYFDGNLMRYDLEIMPGAKPEDIKMRFEGQDGLQVNNLGELEIKTSFGTINHGKIFAYQEIGGIKKAIPCSFILNKEGNVSFKTEYYDKTIPLIIDPLVFSSYLSGPGPYLLLWSDVSDEPGGNVVVAGGGIEFMGLFPVTPGAYKTIRTLGDIIDGFISKFNTNTGGLIFSTLFGGSDNDICISIDVDDAGYIYVNGVTCSADFPITPFAIKSTIEPLQYDAYISKLLPNGSGLVFSTYIGGSHDEDCDDICVDASGNVFVIGTTLSNNFPVTPGAFQVVRAGNDDIFVAKVNPTGSAYIFSTLIGGPGNDDVGSFTVDETGAVYVIGTSDGVFPVTPGSFQTVLKGVIDPVVLKLNPTGSSLVFSTYLGGTNEDLGLGIDIDLAKRIYVCGYTKSADFPITPGALQTVHGGGQDGFITKLESDGSSLIYSTFLGGVADDESVMIKTTTGNGLHLKRGKLTNHQNSFLIPTDAEIVVLGNSLSDNFPTTPNAYQNVNRGIVNCCITKINTTGNEIYYSTYIGGDGADQALRGRLNGNLVYFTGSSSSTNYPTTPNAFLAPPPANLPCFISVFDISNPPLGVITKPATQLTFESARLNGSANPGGFLTSVLFQYGKYANYGSITNITGSPINGVTSVDVGSNITGLDPNMEYHYRLTADNGSGNIIYGNDMVFKTLPAIPILIYPEDKKYLPTNIVNFKWDVIRGADSYILQVSIDPNFESFAINASLNTKSYESRLHSLQKYYWRVAAVNSSGVTWSAVYSFNIHTLVISPLVLDFGVTSINNPAPIGYVTLTNTGTDEIFIQDIRLNGDNSFSFVNNVVNFKVLGENAVTAGRKIYPGIPDTLKIQFYPVTEGLKTSRIVFQGDSIISTFDVLLIGTGGGKPVLQADNKINFGQVIFNSGKDSFLVVKNNGNLDLNLTLSFNTTNNSFGYRSEDERMIISPGSSGIIHLRCSGNLPVGDKYSQLKISSNDPVQNPFFADLYGTMQSPFLEKECFRLYFDSLDVGNSTTTTVSLKNTGNYILLMSELFIDGPYAEEFVLNSPPSNIPPGGEYTVSVTFKPLGPGMRYARIAIKSNDPLFQESAIILIGYGKSTYYLSNSNMIAAKNTEDNTTIIEWKKVKEAEKYIVEISTDTNFNGSNTQRYISIISNRKSIAGLDNNRKYYFRVRPENKNIVGQWSEITEFTPSGNLLSMEIKKNIPNEVKLYQNYPNPFNPSTVISYELPENGYVKINIYDVMGKEVATLMEGTKQAGLHEVVWDAKGVPSGIYYYKLVVGSFVEMKKLILLK